MEILLLEVFIGWVIAKILDRAWVLFKKAARVASTWIKRHSPILVVSRRRYEELELREKALKVLVEQGANVRRGQTLNEESEEKRGIA